MKFNLPLFLCFALSLCFIAKISKAQGVPTSDAQYFVAEPFPKSPNVASFTKYGDYDVSEYTGVPNISIPLYTIEAGGIKIPITLSYHASGNKLTDVASWVGLGWSLAGGGAISRRIMGGPDDGTYGYLSVFKPNYTFNLSVDSDMLYMDNVASGLYDTRPDIYSFDFPGHSGKFFFDGTNAYKPVMLPYAPVAVNYSMSLERFIMTDEHGNIYKFGESDVEKTTTSGAGKTGTPAITSWLPESMISQNLRDTVTFSYGADSLFYPDATSQMQVLTDQLSGHGGSPYSVSNVQGPTTSISTSVTEMPLQQINFRNGKVVFELEDTVRKDINLGIGNNVHALKDIKVYAYNYATKQMEVQKTIILYKSYFGTSSANNFRLRLDSIQILDKGGSIIQHYRFGYNTGITLPYYGNFARDYWGYYNGKDIGHTLTSLIPKMTVPFNGGYVTIGDSTANNRDCDSNYMQAEILDTIYYPTGGHTVFTYQSNRFTNYLGQPQVTGGLRVTSISSYDNINSSPMVKTYVYNTADSNYFLQYHFFAALPQTHRYYVSVQGTETAYYFCVVRNFVSNPNIGSEPFDTAPVVYPSVTEYYGTPAANTGKTDYSFTFTRDNPQPITGRVPTPVLTSYFFARGQLLSKTESLRKSDGTYQVVKNESNTYAGFPLKEYLGVGLIATKIYTNEGGVGNNVPLYVGENVSPNDLYSYVSAYSWIYCQDDLLTSSTTNIYDTNDSTKYTTSTVNYTYGDTTHVQIAKTSHVDSKGNTHITVNKYPFDYLSGGTTHNGVLDTMISRHMYAEVVEKWDSVKDVAASSNFISGAQLNQYKFGNINSGIVPSTISTLSVSSPITNFTPASVVSGVLTGDSRYVQMISFDQYDTKNNIAQYTPRNATPTTILWDYLYDFPIAQIKNSAFSLSYTTMAYTSFEANGKGNWIFSGTPVTDLTAPTGSLDYPLASGNITTASMDNTKAYVVSYWSNGGAATVQYNSTSYPGTAMTTVNGWTYYEHPLPTLGSSSYVTISGTTSIDELRLYPANAQMITYTYAPEGLTSIADTKGSVSHFEYDFFQRLKNIKDFYGNIVSNYGYHTYDQTIGNDAMSNTYTRNNCPAGYSPGSLGYSVPANKYYSSTKASANADAAFDMNTNGQAKANQNCHCTVITTNFTLSNSTGISGFQATFSGIATPYNFPSTGSTIISVPIGTYVTISVGAVGSMTHTFGLTGYTNQVGHNASFSNVAVTSGSNLTLSIN